MPDKRSYMLSDVLGNAIPENTEVWLAFEAAILLVIACYIQIRKSKCTDEAQKRLYNSE